MTDYFGEDANKRIISAVEKRIIATQKRREFHELASSKMAILVVFILSIVLSVILGNDIVKTGVDFALGLPIDPYLFGPGNPTVFGDPSIDGIYATFIRALLIFLITGFIPGITIMWQNITKKTDINGYVATWGTMVAIFILLAVFKDQIATALYG